MSVAAAPLDPDSSLRYRTLADLAVPAKGRSAFLVDALLVMAASLLVAASARVVIPLPWTPVPITGQTFGVLFIGMLLGARRGGCALALYLLEGVAGLPFFYGGAAGAAHLLGPTGGYLWSYPLAAALVGYLAERRWDRRPQGAAVTMAAGALFILTIGSLWLGAYMGGIGAGFVKGMLPFLPGEAIKVAPAGALLPSGWAAVRAFETRRRD